MLKLSFTFKDIVKDYICKNNLYKPTHNTKYTLDQILDVIEYILVTGSSWRSLDLPLFKNNNIKWQSIYHHFDKFSKARVFEKVYKILLQKYFKNNKSGKLKYLSIDSSFILNSYATNVGYNGFYKKKRLSKLSLIVDSNGVPISAIIAKGNKADQTLFNKNIDNILVDIKYNKKNNKHKRYFLADAAYHSAKINDHIDNFNIIPVIWNIKGRKSYKKFNNHELSIYNKRIIVENCFSWIFKCRRVNRRYDRLYANYYSFLFACLCRLLLRRI